MSDDTNRFGLKRYVPKDTREQIKEAAGYGCVICGSAIVEFEHIEPGWADATEHDPNRMTVLCPGCHGKVTRRLISKSDVWRAKANPKARQDGFVRDLLSVDTQNLELRISSSVSLNVEVVLKASGKPLLWFEKPKRSDEPAKLCAIFYGENGNKIAVINRNEFRAFVDKVSVTCQSTILEIQVDGTSNLRIDRDANNSLHIQKFRSSYNGCKIFIENDGSINFKHKGGRTITIGKYEFSDLSNAFTIGAIPSKKLYKAISFAIKVQLLGEPVKNHSGLTVGWRFERTIVNRNYQIVACIVDDRVYNLVHEFIGFLGGSSIFYEREEYSDGEPIYIFETDRLSKSIRRRPAFDVSHRIL